MAPQIVPNAHSPTRSRSRDEMVSAAKQKLKTFREKQAQGTSHSQRRSHSRSNSMSPTTEALPSSTRIATEPPRAQHQKRRSHSRSASILKLDVDNSPRSPVKSSFASPKKPANLGDLNRSFSFGGPTLAAPTMAPPQPSSPTSQQSTPRPSSHHRRRSSVSTRRESADMMGFDLAALNPLKSLGENDKDDIAKIRERALLSLEGKGPGPKAKARTVPELVAPMGFSKVEIPEWKTPDVERTFDWGLASNKPKPVPFSLSNSMAGKRDSFGKNLVPSASSKGELAVLVEEEEEDETEDDKENVATVETQVVEVVSEASASLVCSPTEVHFARAASPSPSRPRPALLNLKALESVPATAAEALPTPTPTPSPTPGPRPGLKPLNLGNPSYAARRQSMIALGSTPKRDSLPASRRQSLRSQSRESGSTHSSRDSLGLGNAVNRFPPTPSTMSPTSAAGVEGFLQKNQEVLISRIDQLEKALAKSRRASVQSNTSTSSSLAEEQLGLIADLKTERNSLVEEVVSWRARVEDLERQAELYASRIEAEHLESTIARERVLELEGKQAAWESERAAYDQSLAHAREDAESWRTRYEEASKGECYWQAQAVSLQTEVKRLEKEVAAARYNSSPNKRWNPTPHRFDGSVSSASTTDVEDALGDMDMWKIRPRVPSPLPNMDVLVEEEEDEVYQDSCEGPSFGEDDYEPRCVEEDEGDVDSDILDEVNQELSPCSGNSVSGEPSQHEFQYPRRGELSRDFQFPGSFPSPAPTQGHARTGSIVKGWQMPRGPVALKSNPASKPDRFFDQLEHLYSSDEDELAPSALNSGSEPAKFGSPEFSTFKGDGGASAFTFGSKRNSVSANFRGHGTRASRASISLAAFNGLGMPPIVNPRPEWIVKDSPPTDHETKPGSDALLGQVSSVVGSLPSQVVESGAGSSSKSGTPGDLDQTPTTPKPPRFIAAPSSHHATQDVTDHIFTSSMTPLPITTTSTSRTLVVRRKPSLTRAQPTGRAPPRVPVDTSHDVSRSPFSISYSRISSRSSGSRNSIIGQEAAAIEAAIAQAQAVAAQAQSRRITFTGLTSLLPWGAISSTGKEATSKSAPLCTAAEREGNQRLAEPRRTSGSGTVTREAQLNRLRRDLRIAGQPVVGVSSSGPCCSRCKIDIIQL